MRWLHMTGGALIGAVMAYLVGFALPPVVLLVMAVAGLRFVSLGGRHDSSAR